MIKAAFFDVDGTLVSHKTKSVPQSARDAIQTLRSRGIPCIIATGRQMGEMEALPVGDMVFDGYITLNGQLCLDARKKMLFGVPIEGEAKKLLLDLFENHRVPISFSEEDRMYLNYVSPEVHQVQEAISSPIPPVGRYTGAPLYLACIYIPGGVHPCLPILREHCIVTWWNSGGADVIARGGGKVKGIQRYLEANGIRPEEIIAFGDGENDLEMLQFAGIGVAMGNAEEAVKAAADYITADIDDDGIAKALKYFDLI